MLANPIGKTIMFTNDSIMSHCIMGVKQNSKLNFPGLFQTELPPKSDLLLSFGQNQA